MSLEWIACPNDWKHAISPDDMTCIKCKIPAKYLSIDEQEAIRKEEVLDDAS